MWGREDGKEEGEAEGDEIGEGEEGERIGVGRREDGIGRREDRDGEERRREDRDGKERGCVCAQTKPRMMRTTRSQKPSMVISRKSTLTAGELGRKVRRTDDDAAKEAEQGEEMEKMGR